jgi:hypothetical protein
VAETWEEVLHRVVFDSFQEALAVVQNVGIPHCSADRRVHCCSDWDLGCCCSCWDCWDSGSTVHLQARPASAEGHERESLVDLEVERHQIHPRDLQRGDSEEDSFHRDILEEDRQDVAAGDRQEGLFHVVDELGALDFYALALLLLPC